MRVNNLCKDDQKPKILKPIPWKHHGYRLLFFLVAGKGFEPMTFGL